MTSQKSPTDHLSHGDPFPPVGPLPGIGYAYYSEKLPEINAGTGTPPGPNARKLVADYAKGADASTLKNCTFRHIITYLSNGPNAGLVHDFLYTALADFNLTLAELQHYKDARTLAAMLAARATWRK